MIRCPSFLLDPPPISEIIVFSLDTFAFSMRCLMSEFNVALHKINTKNSLSLQSFPKYMAPLVRTLFLLWDGVEGAVSTRRLPQRSSPQIGIRHTRAYPQFLCTDEPG